MTTISQVAPHQDSTGSSVVKAGLIGAGVGAGAQMANYALAGKIAATKPDDVMLTIKNLKNPEEIKKMIDSMPDGFLKKLYQKRFEKGKLTGKDTKASLEFLEQSAKQGKIAWKKLPKAPILKAALVVGGVAAAIAGLISVCKKS